MNLEDFTIVHGLRHARLDECNDLNIIGKRGDIYEHGNGLLAAMIIRAPKRHWYKYRLLAKQLGCRIIQNGDSEGAFVFDPENREQAELAILGIRAPRKRKVSPELREKLARDPASGRILGRKRDSSQQVE